MHPEVPLLPSCSPAIARLPQDFEFPAGCQRIKVTPDGQYIFASGYHPPQVPQGRAALFAPSTVRCAACGCAWVGRLVVPRRWQLPARKPCCASASFTR